MEGRDLYEEGDVFTPQEETSLEKTTVISDQGKNHRQIR